MPLKCKISFSRFLFIPSLHQSERFCSRANLKKNQQSSRSRQNKCSLDDLASAEQGTGQLNESMANYYRDGIPTKQPGEQAWKKGCWSPLIFKQDYFTPPRAAALQFNLVGTTSLTGSSPGYHRTHASHPRPLLLFRAVHVVLFFLRSSSQNRARLAFCII